MRGFKEQLVVELELEKQFLNLCRQNLVELGEDSAGLTLHGEKYYYYVVGKKRMYAGTDNPRIQKMKSRRILQEAIATCEKNLRILETALNHYQDFHFDALNQKLPKAYQGGFLPSVLVGMNDTNDRATVSDKFFFTHSENPYMREQLKHKTSFGLWVRSKSELILAEQYYQSGVPFCYEKQVIMEDADGEHCIIYPDFSLKGKNGWIYHEHFGMLSSSEYSERAEKKIELYHKNDVLTPHKLIITMDNQDGAIDAEGFQLVIQGIIKPQL